MNMDGKILIFKKQIFDIQNRGRKPNHLGSTENQCIVSFTGFNLSDTKKSTQLEKATLARDELVHNQFYTSALSLSIFTTKPDLDWPLKFLL